MSSPVEKPNKEISKRRLARDNDNMDNDICFLKNKIFVMSLIHGPKCA